MVLDNNYGSGGRTDDGLIEAIFPSVSVEMVGLNAE